MKNYSLISKIKKGKDSFLENFEVVKESLSTLVYKKLLSFIMKEDTMIGHQLESEKALSQKMNVSRPVLREALQRLEYEGYITRKHGVGTFIISKKANLSSGLEKLDSITQIVEEQGFQIGTLFVSEPISTSQSTIEECLNLTKEDPMISYYRIRTADERPLALDYFYMHEKYKKDSMTNGTHESIFNYFKKELHIEIHSSACTLYALNTTPEISKLMGVPENTAVQVMEQTFYSDTNHPIFFGISYLDTSLLRFRLSRRR